MIRALGGVASSSARLALATSVAFALSAPLEAANLVTNPEFVSAISGWTPVGAGSSFWEPTQGSPAVGSARLVAIDGNTLRLTQCVAPAAWPVQVDLIARTFTNIGAGSLGVEVEFFQGAGCTGTSLGTVPATTVVNVGGSWFERSVTSVTTPGGTTSALVSLVVTANPIVVPTPTPTPTATPLPMARAGRRPNGVPVNTMDVAFDFVRFGETGTVPVVLTKFTAR